MKTIYIILGIVVVAVIAWLVFGKKNTADTATTGDAATEPANSGNWFTNFGTGRSNQTWAQWFNKNMANGWPMNTSISGPFKPSMV